MNTVKWILIAYMTVQTILLIGRIGEPRPTVTKGGAIAGMVEFGVLVWLVVIA